MKDKLRNERILFIVSGFLLLSIILMVAVIPVMLTNTSSNIAPKSSAIGVSVAIIIHLIILILCVKFTRESRHSRINRKGEYIGIGIIPILLGLIYMDGAIAFVSHEDTLFISILMFATTLCDFVASTMMITLFFLKPQQAHKTNTF